MSETGPDVDLTRHVRVATRWVAAAQVISQLVSLIVLAALFRLVAQSDFGLMGMAVPLVFLLRSLASTGLTVAAVQQTRLSDAQVSTLFWLQLGVAAVVTLATAACGPLLAWTYQTPPLMGVCAALAGTTLVAAGGATHQALLERKLQLGPLAAIRLVAQAAGGAGGVTAALAGWGVWALVAQQYIELFVLTVGLWGMVPFRPRLPGRGEPVWSLVHFSGWHTLSGILFAIAHNLDKILLAVLLGSTQGGRALLGMYTQAYNLMIKPVYLVSTPLTGLMLPALSRARPQPEVYRQFIARFYRMVGIVLLPCGAGLLVVAEDLMRVLGGPQWHHAGTILQALAPAVLVLGSINIAGSVLSSAGKAKQLAIGAAGIAVAVTLGIGTGILLFSAPPADPAAAAVGTAVGTAWGLSLTLTLAVFPIYMGFCTRAVDASLAQVVKPQFRALLAALGMGLCVWLLRQWALPPLDLPRALQLALLVTTGVITYTALAWEELCWLRRQLLPEPVD